MKPWVGAVAVAAAILVSPGAAFADDDAPALLKFQLDNSSQYDDFEALGFAMDHNVDERRRRRHHRQRLGQRRGARDRSRTRLRERRRRPQQAELRGDPRGEPALQAGRDRRQAALRENAAGVKGASAAPGSVRAAAGRVLREQRRQVHLDRGQRRRRDLHRHQRQHLQRPDADGRVLRRRGQPPRHRPLPAGRLHRHRRQPGLLPVPLGPDPLRQQGRQHAPAAPRSRSRPTTATSTPWPRRNGSRRTRRASAPTSRPAS